VAIGTESNLVNRLKNEHPELYIVSLSPEPSFCRTMGLVTLEKLAYVMDELAERTAINRSSFPLTWHTTLGRH